MTVLPGPPLAPDAAPGRHLSVDSPLDVAVAATIGRPAPWRAAALAACFGIVVAILLTVAVVLAFGVPTNDDVLAGYSLAGEACYGAAVFLVARRVAVRCGGWRRAFGLDRPLRGDLGTIAAWSGLQLLARIGTAVILTAAIPALQGRSVGNLGGVGDLGPVGVLLLAVGAVIVAPFVEEFAFRGVLLRALLRRYPFAVAAAISGFAFGALHAFSADNWPSVVFLVPVMTVFGVLQCILVRRTARLGPAMGVHAVTNLLAVALAVASAHA